jgi:hypothetical protein
MEEENIKNAFSKVKQDMDELRTEISEIKELIKGFQDEFYSEKLHKLAEKPLNNTLKKTSTLRHITSTHPATSTDTSTVPQEVEGLKPLNLGISTGNQGASTDRQTDTSTDTSTDNLSEIPSENIEENIYEASEILDSLDQIKKQIRRKFKRLTDQEITVFSTIYQLEEKNPQVTYQIISKTLNLSQSSVRDYVQRMINKGIPIKKQKINNKKVILSISPELKKIATLSTILQLREL